MALPILDGNQTATTLSTVLTSGEHIPAHTVVSLGSTAISNITSAVSGSVVSISNFPSTQTIAGTVTANVLGYSESNSAYFPIPVVPNDEAIIGYQVAVKIKQTGEEAVPISGTVTANVPYQDINAGIADWVASTNDPIPVAPFGDTLPISGTVTANVGGIASGVTIPVRLFAEAVGGPSSGQDTLVVCDSGGQLLVNANAGGSSVLGYDGNAFVQVKQVSGSSVTIGANPSGALTTRFGSVATANLAFITSAVTNTNRKYLLAQNISAGTVTIGIGFSPTTTQGIQLTAGGGLTFDAFCPTGAVYWLGAVTGAAFTILEG